MNRSLVFWKWSTDLPAEKEVAMLLLLSGSDEELKPTSESWDLFKTVMQQLDYSCRGWKFVEESQFRWHVLWEGAPAYAKIVGEIVDDRVVFKIECSDQNLEQLKPAIEDLFWFGFTCFDRVSSRVLNRL